MIVYGEQNVQIPNHSHFGEYMLSYLRQAKGDDVCLENGVTHETLTYKEATQYAVNLAAAFSKLGVKGGDVVAIASEAFLHYVPTALAVTFTGAAYTPYELEIGRVTLKHKLQLTKPKYFVCSVLFWRTYKDVLQSSDCIEIFIAVSDIPDLPISLKSLMMTINVDINVEMYQPKAVSGQTDTVLILYSSGTTGMPKGVEITHHSCILTCLSDAFRHRTSLQTAFMAMAGPWFVNMGVFMTYKFLVMGRKIVYTTDLSIDTVLPIFKNSKVNVIFTTPAYIRDIATSDVPIKDNFDSVKMIYCRSAPLREHTIKLLKERFPKVKDVIQAMGLTECGEPMSEIWAPKSKPGSVGIVSPGVQVKIVDPNTREILGPNQQGEICVKGSMSMKGYLEIDRFDYLDKDGYYKTGDLGYFDEENYFYIIDRLTDVILMRSLKISPVEVENVLLQHEGVQDAAVIGKPEPDSEQDGVTIELPMAFVVRKPGSKVTEKELIEFVALEVSPYKQLTGGVRFIPELPRNPRGKILRRKLKEMLLESE